MVDIKQLVKDWYYTKKCYVALESLYLNGQSDLLKMVVEEEKEVDKIEGELFSILKEEYRVKYPYQEIPLDLDYVLKLVS